MALMTPMRGVTKAHSPPSQFGPGQIHSLYTGISVPDPITFISGERWLNRPNLYPRQATLIKVVFLREDLFTDYDYTVVAEWEEAFRLSNGTEGICPGTLDKMRWLKANGHRWFREVLLVMGRRAGKGHVTALCMAYVLWCYMAKGDPQGFYGVDRDKKLVCLIFAGKRDQAKATVFGDLVNVITGSTCFAPFISDDHTEKLSIYAPHDFVRMERQAAKGIRTERDQATFVIQPRESTLMAGRGPTSFAQCLDPATRVLKADLSWVPIGDLEVGDEVVGVDEYPTQGAQRRMRGAQVEAVWRTRKKALRFTFVDGTSVVCSPDHRWLCRELGMGGTSKWRTAGDLRPGHRIKHVVDPWEYDESREAGYLAGIYDGEGCVSGYHKRTGKSVFFSQNPGPTLDHTLSLLKDKGFTPQRHNGGVENKAQQWALDGVSEHMAFLGSIRPVRLLPKARGVWDGVAMRGGRTPTGRQRPESHKTILSVEELPEQDLVDITTTTRTFLAEGLISHNCFDEMAHIVASGANRSAGEVYGAAKPSLDQFGKDAFIAQPSSPWQMLGQYYENWVNANAKDEHGEFLYPDMLSIQLASWDIYLDWERTAFLPLLPEGFLGDLGEYAEDSFDPQPVPEFVVLRGAIQVFDEQMEREERANPDTFKVERRCLDPDTRVLKADLTWARIDDLQPGDQVVGLDEHPSEPGKQRKMRVATVNATWDNHDQAYRITFTDGTSVVCSGNHRWFSSTKKDGPGAYRWRSINRLEGVPGPRHSLKPGDKVAFLAEPWEQDRSWEAGYLAGVYDGEGTVASGPRREFRIAFVQNPGEVLDATLEHLRTKGFRPAEIPSHSLTPEQVTARGRNGYTEDGRRRAKVYVVTGLADCMRFVGQVGGYKMARQAVPALYDGRGLGRVAGRSPYKVIVAIEPVGRRRLVDIETSTGTFVAEGLWSHNSKWAAALDAYLNEAKVNAIFEPWLGRPARYGPPYLEMQTRGVLTYTYKGHADPSKVNDKFGYALAHPEYDDEGRPHCVFDLVGHFDPADFPDHIIDYEHVDDWLWEHVIKAFVPEEFTFDQYNSTSSIQKLQKRVRGTTLPKRVQVFEKTSTRQYDWTVKENSKAAINLDLVHSPYNERAALELRFLQEVNGRVDHPASGPVQSKDIADAMMECVHVLIGEQVNNFLHSEMTNFRPGAGMQGGMTPFAEMMGNTDGDERLAQLSAFGKARGRPDQTPSMGRANRRGRW